ncbi:TIGR01458 family HAD-type hydrolase [Reichenbachiella carrageenanivorans]|uniref:Haloacid dehalogenase-like hydrolase domain-containing protein 2 n=1 Tax=Reichenbachiella carrageenanivorans TaxID=2979869 RepID=A0ABY6CYV2_9BACT|nr:TIGR01458 family HAD-type hydrolase [Reichenbachiella carrageenanivorans]UXX78574.1 TIGR01458 family HAD-type hydrolase [Reichenbachiella carrageenanivorans]
MNPIKGLLIDIDGVLIEDGHALDKAVDKLNELKSNYSIRLLTNTTTKRVKEIHQMLTRLGFDIHQNEIVTAPVAAQILLKHSGYTRIYPVVSTNILPEFEGFTFDEKEPQAIVVGDIGRRWDYDLLNQIFKPLMSGAELIALHKGKFWKSEGALQLDIGAFVAGLEYATGKAATVIGKPSRSFFDAALKSMGLPKNEVLMIGDDIDGDIGGAQHAGIKACLVKTGKYNEQFVAQSELKPDQVIATFAALSL